MKNTPSFTGVAQNFAKPFGTLLLNLCLRISYTASLSDAQNYRFLTMEKKKKMGRGSSLPKGEKTIKTKKKGAKLYAAPEPGSFACVWTHHIFPVRLFDLCYWHNKLNKQKKPSTRITFLEGVKENQIIHAFNVFPVQFCDSSISHHAVYTLA